MSVTFAKMHKALISARLTFTSRNPSVKPTHSRGKLQNQNRHIHILWKSDYKYAHAHTYSWRMKTLNPFSIILSTGFFQAFTFIFLWSRKSGSLLCSVNPVLKFICYTSEQPWSKLVVGMEITHVQDLLRVTETICSQLNNDQVLMLRRRGGRSISSLDSYHPSQRKSILIWYVPNMSFTLYVQNIHWNGRELRALWKQLE